MSSSTSNSNSNNKRVHPCDHTDNFNNNDDGCIDDFRQGSRGRRRRYNPEGHDEGGQNLPSMMRGGEIERSVGGAVQEEQEESIPEQDHSTVRRSLMDQRICQEYQHKRIDLEEEHRRLERETERQRIDFLQRRYQGSQMTVRPVQWTDPDLSRGRLNNNNLGQSNDASGGAIESVDARQSNASAGSGGKLMLQRSRELSTITTTAATATASTTRGSSISTNPNELFVRSFPDAQKLMLLDWLVKNVDQSLVQEGIGAVLTRGSMNFATEESTRGGEICANDLVRRSRARRTTFPSSSVDAMTAEHPTERILDFPGRFANARARRSRNFALRRSRRASAHVGSAAGAATAPAAAAVNTETEASDTTNTATSFNARADAADSSRTATAKAEPEVDECEEDRLSEECLQDEDSTVSSFAEDCEAMNGINAAGPVSSRQATLSNEPTETSVEEEMEENEQQRFVEEHEQFEETMMDYLVDGYEAMTSDTIHDQRSVHNTRDGNSTNSIILSQTNGQRALSEDTSSAAWGQPPSSLSPYKFDGHSEVPMQMYCLQTVQCSKGTMKAGVINFNGQLYVQMKVLDKSNGYFVLYLPCENDTKDSIRTVCHIVCRAQMHFVKGWPYFVRKKTSETDTIFMDRYATFLDNIVRKHNPEQFLLSLDPSYCVGIAIDAHQVYRVVSETTNGRFGFTFESKSELRWPLHKSFSAFKDVLCVPCAVSWAEVRSGVCPICIDPLVTNTRSNITNGHKDIVKLASCSHHFHRKCILQSIRGSPYRPDCCPCCRTKVAPLNVDSDDSLRFIQGEMKSRFFKSNGFDPMIIFDYQVELCSMDQEVDDDEFDEDDEDAGVRSLGTRRIWGRMRLSPNTFGLVIRLHYAFQNGLTFKFSKCPISKTDRPSQLLFAYSALNDGRSEGGTQGFPEVLDIIGLEKDLDNSGVPSSYACLKEVNWKRFSHCIKEKDLEKFDMEEAVKSFLWSSVARSPSF